MVASDQHIGAERGRGGDSSERRDAHRRRDLSAGRQVLAADNDASGLVGLCAVVAGQVPVAQQDQAHARPIRRAVRRSAPLHAHSQATARATARSADARAHC